MKLRAWDHRHKKMFNVTSIHLGDEYPIEQVDYEDDRKTEFNVHKPRYGYPYRDHGHVKECVVMRSTGTNDKNGVEIYEGDIIKSIYGLCEIKYGPYNNGEAYAEDSDYGTGFYYTNGNYKCVSFGDEIHNEVVSNIYENPEFY